MAWRLASMSLPFVVGLSSLFDAGIGGPASAKPNILFILADDMGYGDVGYLQTGSAHGRLLTPTLDKLTSDGMRFTDAYCGSPVCAPSRCTLITGKHSGHCTVRSNGPILSANDVGIGAVLHKAGYKSHLIGKWGLGPINSTGDPLSKGFDTFYGQTDQRNCHNYYPPYMYENRQQTPIQANLNASDEACGTDREHCSWSGDLWTERAVSVLKEHGAAQQKEGADRVQPFFMYLSYTAPHAGSVGTDGEHGEPVPRISKGPYADKTGKWGLEVEYAAAVTEIDTQVGLVLEALDSATPLLYNLENDLGQRIDVAEAHPDIVAKLMAVMKEQHVPGDYCGHAFDGAILADARNFEDAEDSEAFWDASWDRLVV